MSSATHPRARRAWILALVAAVGLAAGWFLVRHHGRSFEYVYAVLDPACMAAMAIGLLHRQAKQSRWLVPLLLLGAMVDVAIHPHAPLLTAVGLATGVVAIFGSLCGHNRSAIVATLLCCTSISASLLVGLLNRSVF
jgi:hypothetical protein